MKQNTQPFVLGSFGTGMTITCFTGYESKFLDCKELPAYFKKQLVHQMGTYIAGWLSIAGISSDHPVMQSRSPFSPTHFEKYDCWNRPDLAGCIHIDSRVMTSAAYLPILFPRYPYDNITNALVKYQSLDFARQHPIINFESIKGGESRYKLAAVFTEAQSDPLHVNVVEPLVEETFTAQWQMLSEYSWYRAADVQYGDRLIVLCTCSYSHRNERTVVVARQMRAGESETVSIAKNPEAKSPW